MDIFVFDNMGPETTAMLQALYSRSDKSVMDHFAKVQKNGPNNFMRNYYVGYGHSSIGDCGHTTLFFENVSLLAAKAIQDNPLYAGQESSTRYLNFVERPLVDPINDSFSKQIMERWIEFYNDYYNKVAESIRYNVQSFDDDSETFNKAVFAQTFDIMRGFLPAGITTQLSWSTSLSQAHEHLQRLETHPLVEVQNAGKRARSLLKDRYPSSFSHEEPLPQINFLRQAYQNYAYLEPNFINEPIKIEKYAQNEIPKNARTFLEKRPKGVKIIRPLANLSRYKIQCVLDFGSFRDLQRHRNGYCRMPLLTPMLGFNQWYINQLPSDVSNAACCLLNEQRDAVNDLIRRFDLFKDNEVIQYYLPIGYNVYCELDYDLAQMVYVAELRSGKTVHPTLRPVAQAMINQLRHDYPFMALYGDTNESEFSYKRGRQDIVPLNN